MDIVLKSSIGNTRALRAADGIFSKFHQPHVPMPPPEPDVKKSQRGAAPARGSEAAGDSEKAEESAGVGSNRSSIDWDPTGFPLVSMASLEISMADGAESTREGPQSQRASPKSQRASKVESGPAVGAQFLNDVEKAREKQVSGGELSDARFSQGVGLGLPLSYNIVNSLGGELCYTSEVRPQPPAPSPQACPGGLRLVNHHATDVARRQ